MSQKRVVAIHDISCFGKCSLTVALPVISACGIECAVIPTAVLSTHTGGFKEYTFRDLTGDILPIVNHWKKEGITADAFYTGYLGSKQQAEIVKNAIRLLKREGDLVICDPAMADNGSLYPGFADDFPAAMLKLCQTADILVPNITEASLLTGIPYENPPYTKEYIDSLLDALFRLTGARIVLTGVDFGDGKLGAAVYEEGKTSFAFEPKIPVFYHGTGDTFAAAMTGMVLNGASLAEAAALAAKFVCSAIHHTMEENPDRRYGVNFESALPMLTPKRRD